MSSELGEPGKPGYPGEEPVGALGGRGGEGGAGGRGGTPGRATRPWAGYIAAILASVSILLSAWLTSRDNEVFHRITQEGAERRDQNCNLFEGEHLAAVTGLRRTYAYLETLPPDEVDSAINQLIIRLLPEAEQEARQDAAPDYCDEPNTGLPEPDPKLPPRQDFSHLLKERP